MAAAGLIALAEGPKRLPEDHENARRLAEGVAQLLPGATDPGQVQTNIVFVDVAATGHAVGEWQQRLAAAGVLVTMVPGRIRMLTHADVTARDIETALAAWQSVAAEIAVSA
jgi:threonine aldolase